MLIAICISGSPAELREKFVDKKYRDSVEALVQAYQQNAFASKKLLTTLNEDAGANRYSDIGDDPADRLAHLLAAVTDALK